MGVVGDPFEYTATGILGDKRDTMLANQLLLRTELGQPMRRGYGSYPGDEFRYGRPMNIKEGGASRALRGWAGNEYSFPGGKATGGSTNAAVEGSSGRDFVALNKAAVQAGLITAPENYIFRTSHDIRRKPLVSSGDARNRGNGARRLPPSMVYGISTRPSTPVHDLLEHRYQDEWLKEHRSANTASSNKDSRRKSTPGQVYDTRTSLLRVHQIPVDSAPLWKMPKFSRNAHGQLNTFRSEKARSASYAHHEHDGIARKGMMRHGIYTAATS